MVSVVANIKSKKLEDIPIVSEYPDVFPEDLLGLPTDREVKIPEQYFQGKEDKTKTNKRLKKELAEFDNANLKEADETRLLIWKNELVCGVIDKAQFGKYGLVHTVQELYGPDIAGLLLGAFSRLFTSFLQFHGFTCGLDDLMVAPDCDKEMRMELEGEDVGEKVHRKVVNLENQKIGTNLSTKI
ncbi:DNA-directed RNA polymerase I subunit 1-like [Helianthus annuus]|uniref:DNA-directed RNA polymerase I subunit 1-like n=1 Tax=Helianthus annuus TaxID=4232 RepID=UPI000B8F91B2|nr:DNA-directed RNA polymerase I subunit 1-like [Helianthus annuus]